MSTIMMKTVALNESEARLEITDLEPEGYRFHKGQRVKFTGLLDHPEYNGQEVVIRDYRPCNRSNYCPSGKAYYLVGGTPWGDDWVYQERLTAVPEENKQ